MSEEKRAIERSWMTPWTILLIVFVVLKLAGLVDWSWYWVLSPLWIPAAFWCGFALTILSVLGLGAGFARMANSGPKLPHTFPGMPDYESRRRAAKGGGA